MQHFELCLLEIHMVNLWHHNLSVFQQLYETSFGVLVGSAILVIVWLAVGVSGLLLGLLWLRSVESLTSRVPGGASVRSISTLHPPAAPVRRGVVDDPAPGSLAG